MLKNRFWISKNQNSKMVLQFLDYSEKGSLDELLNIDEKEIHELITNYENYLESVNSYSTITNKIERILLFYSINKRDIILS